MSDFQFSDHRPYLSSSQLTDHGELLHGVPGRAVDLDPYIAPSAKPALLELSMRITTLRCIGPMAHECAHSETVRVFDDCIERIQNSTTDKQPGKRHSSGIKNFVGKLRSDVILEGEEGLSEAVLGETENVMADLTSDEILIIAGASLSSKDTRNLVVDITQKE